MRATKKASRLARRLNDADTTPEEEQRIEAELESLDAAVEAEQRERITALQAKGWREETCGSCRGYGVVSDYGAMGTDFYGAKDCGGCHGTGRVWRTPKGKYALYPGGPFVG